MAIFRAKLSAVIVVLFLSVVWANAAQISKASDEEFGPVVRAYLGYLRNEQEVVDDRVSRREISMTYYRRNSNRIKALRQMAIRLARETHNDYLPELEAVASNEFGLLFERRPQCCEILSDSWARFTREGRSTFLLVWIRTSRPNLPKKLPRPSKSLIPRKVLKLDLEP